MDYVFTAMACYTFWRSLFEPGWSIVERLCIMAFGFAWLYAAHDFGKRQEARREG